MLSDGGFIDSGKLDNNTQKLICVGLHFKTL